MTNFEYYRDKILEITDNGEDICIINGKLSSCNSLDSCDYCDWCEKDVIKDDPCGAMKYKWLYAEHVDKPKLTGKERMFCELMGYGWIITNRNNEIIWTVTKPYKKSNMWHVDHFAKSLDVTHLFDLKFGFIKHEDEEPWNIKDLLKLEIIEE